MTTEQLDDHQDDLERTRVTSRRRLAQESLEEAERTVIVDRAPRSDDTVVVERSGPAEDTVVVERSVPAEDTVVVERSGPAEDTVVVERSGPAEDTVVVERSGPVEDTAVVEHGAAESPLPAVPVLRAPVLRTRGDRRRGIAPPPVPAGFAPAPKPAVGPGAIESYPARDVAPSAQIAPAPLGGVDPTRDVTRELPSAGRRARRLGRIAVAAFALACLVSVGGLLSIAIALI
ncbi:hypothetical protein [Salinibacterium sp. ZJ77]|uniref:hypothetical protein n=1 Tax=Salinibacterium sp. ZJ77 TaxID=2708337 RepID=UPI001423371A|nr:hypothetical protein [Salinibacterium sp. ZJ77]